jgi:hypothetical protein
VEQQIGRVTRFLSGILFAFSLYRRYTNMSNLEKVNIKALICDLLQEAGGLGSWNQIGDYIADHGSNPLGTTALAYDPIVFWIGHQDFIEGVAELRDEGLIDIVVVSPMVYSMDGAAPNLLILSPRRLGILLRDWNNTGWIEQPVWVPTVLVLTGIDFFGKPITSRMLQAAVEGCDEGILWREEFENLVSEIELEPCHVDEAGERGQPG